MSALIISGSLAACGDRPASPAAGTFTPRVAGVLTVVTSDVPTTGFWEGSADHLTGGLEYELARNLAQRFGLRSVQVRLQPFHQIVDGRLAGADLALDLITPTAQRERGLEFSSPYLNAAPTVVVRSHTAVPDLATARTLRWGTVRGTTLGGIVSTLIDPDDRVTVFDATSAMLAGLEHHQVDAILLDQALAVVTADRSGGRLRAVAQLPAPETIAAALPKGSPNLDAVDSALRAFTADGTLHRLLQRWIGAAAANAQTSIPLLRSTR